MNISDDIRRLVEHLRAELFAGIGLVGAYLIRKFIRRKLLGGIQYLEVQSLTKEKVMAVQKVDVVMQVPKELKEIIDAVASILRDVKAKKSVAEIGAGNLTKLFAAVEGHEALGEELKSDGKDEAAGYLVQQHMDALGI